MGRPSANFWRRVITGAAIVGLSVMPFSSFASEQSLPSQEATRISELLTDKTLIAHCVYSKKQKKWVGCEDENAEHVHEPEPSETVAPVETIAVEATPTPTVEATVAPSETPTATVEPAASSSNEAKWIDALKTLTIPANGTFSFREWVESSKLPKLGLKSTEKMASQIYRAAIYAGLMIGEREIHTSKNEISIPGFDVNLSKPEFQLTLWNPYQAELKLEMIAGGTSWELRAKEIEDPNWKKPSIEMVEMQVQPTVQVFAVMNGGTDSMLSQEGQAGALIKVYRVDKNKRTIISRDYYEPVPNKMRVNALQ